MRGIVKGLLVAAAAVAVAVPAAAIASAGEPPVSVQIIGGNNATETYSFMAHLNSSDGWGCGAALIRPTWIITARHCVTGDNDAPSAPGTLSFRIGTLQENSGGTVARAKRVIRYEGSPEADTALVELTAPVSEKPINIASSAPVGSQIRIIGWGCIKDPGCEGPDVLQQLDTSILADNACGGGSSYLCINNPDGWRGACYGDSGGPAVLRSGTNWVLGGNTSGGTSAICGQGPSVYVELPNFRSWIEGFAGPDGGGTPPPPTTTPPGTTNLALNRPTKSKQAPCAAAESPAKAVDGLAAKSTDKWCSGEGATKQLEVDLGANKALKRLVVKHAGAGGEAAALNTKNFTLETSTGGGVWTTAATVANNTASTTTTTVAVTARWIRISTTDPVARIYEFEAYA
jgi:hypothetical protein